MNRAYIGAEAIYIFLDIDGTISSSLHSIERDVASYLNELSASGFELCFVTGRSYLWAKNSLSFLSGPCLLSWQNGAVILDLSTREVLAKRYIQKEMLPLIDLIADSFGQDYVIYTGRENHAFCYYRKGKFTSENKKRLLSRAEKVGEEWIEVDSFRELPVDSFPAVKFFGDRRQLQALAQEMNRSIHLHIPVIADPVIQGNFVAQGTMTNKGDAIDAVLQVKDKGWVIAAGDDMNDLDMLKKADVKVAIETAPRELLEISDIVCPPAHQSGIIKGLREAIESLKGKRLSK